MTIQELYDFAVQRGIEDYTILVADTTLRSSYYGEYFTELDEIYVDDDRACVTI